MNRHHLLAVTLLCIFAGSSAKAQVTNLKINGFSSNFTVVQGDSLKWEYDLPVGGTATGEIWIDLNGNGVIDPTIDKSMFGNFTQTDGQVNGNNGPGDMDSLVNGKCLLAIANNGQAPAKYIVRFSNNGVGQSVAGTITALPLPTYTVSGKVTPPAAASALNILVGAQENRNGGGVGWWALTDVSGNYHINFNASAGGVQWRIAVQDQFPPYIVSPTDSTITLTGNISGLNFSYAQPAAKVVGYFKGEDGHVFANLQVQLNPYHNGGNNTGKTATTDANGFFQFGYTSSEINAYPLWQVTSNNDGVAPSYFPPQSGSISIHQYDSLRVDLTAFVANDSISGKITIDGHAPNNYSFSVFAGTQDSGNTNANSDPLTGNFTLHVTRRIYDYYVGISNNSIPVGYIYVGNITTAHPGDNNIIFRIVKPQITLKSDSSTLAVGLGAGVPSNALLSRLDTSDTAGLGFVPALVGAFGTYTGVPNGAPTGTVVVNIPLGDGQNGYFKVSFTLPSAFSGTSLWGSANIDDVGRVFLNGHPLSPSILGTDPGRLTEGGNATFRTDDSSFFRSGINELIFSDANTYGGPSGAAFFATIAFVSGVTGIKEIPDQIPASFLLEQNYPNPFNPSTMIRFSIAKVGYVTLKVYNMLGQEIATLVNGERAAGEYNISWQSNSLPSGVYFYRLSAGTFVEVKKMLLLK